MITTHNAALMNAYKKDELMGVSVVYRKKDKGTSKIASFVDIDNFPSMLASGGLGNAMNVKIIDTCYAESVGSA